MKFERINPITGAVASSAPAMQPSDIPAIADKAAFAALVTRIKSVVSAAA